MKDVRQEVCRAVLLTDIQCPLIQLTRLMTGLIEAAQGDNVAQRKLSDAVSAQLDLRKYLLRKHVHALPVPAVSYVGMKETFSGLLFAADLRLLPVLKNWARQARITASSPLLP